MKTLTISMLPSIKAACEAVPWQSTTARLTDICERYMTMVDDILRREHIADEEWAAIRAATQFTEGSMWRSDLTILERFPIVSYIAIIERLEREVEGQQNADDA